MRQLTIDKKEVNGSIDVLIDILNKKFEMNDKRLERIEEKLDTHYELLLELRAKMDEMLTRNEFHSTIQNYPTRKEMDDRFQDLGESLNARFDKVDDRMNKIEKLVIKNSNDITKIKTSMGLSDDPD